MNTDAIEKKWTARVEKLLIGRKIVAVRYMSSDEAQEFDWYCRPITIHLDNGLVLCPAADDEGNNGGALFTDDEKMPVIPVMR